MIANSDEERRSQDNSLDVLAPCLEFEVVLEAVDCAERSYGGDWLAVARDLARVMCARETYFRDTDIEFLILALQRHRAGSLCGLFDAALSGCAHHVIPDFVRAVVTTLWDRDPELAMHLADEVSGAQVFTDYRTQAGVLALSEVALLSSDESLVNHLRSMNVGQYGGSALQIDYSITYSARLFNSGERLEHVVEICDAGTLIPDDPRIGIGSTLAHFALAPHDGTPIGEARAAEALMRLLHDPRFGGAAAVTIANDYPEPPAFFSQSTWDEIRAHAELLASL